MVIKWRRTLSVIVTSSCLTLVANSLYAGVSFDLDDPRGGIHHGRTKNAIIMVADGTDIATQTLSRWFKGSPLHVDLMQPGNVMVHIADSIIADSAPSATAFATGHKTTVPLIGVGPDRENLLTGFEPTAEPYAPLASVLVAAQLAGKSTGIIATSRVTHATPAAYAAHVPHRGLENDIMEQMVYNNVDVVFGGGARHLLPAGHAYVTSFGAEWTGQRPDGEDLIEELLTRGYQFVDSREEMLQLSGGKVWGMFSASHMQPELDRPHFAPTEPSLAEMVAKAIEILSQNPRGFLLMVEGSQVDWATHNNDPAYLVHDFLIFDDAVGVAKDFARRDRQTLVMAFSDHATGGMSIGHYDTPMDYYRTSIEDLVDPIRNMSLTAGGVVAKMSDQSDAALVESVRRHWSLELSHDDVSEIRALQPSVGLAYALARVVSHNHTIIGWTTHGHTGETVPLWMTGGKAPNRVIDGTELAHIAAASIGVDLDNTTRSLFVDLDEITSDYYLDKTDPANLVLMVGDAAFPIHKDYMIRNGQIIQLPGLTVHAPVTGKFYLSREAIEQLGLDRKGSRGRGKAFGHERAAIAVN